MIKRIAAFFLLLYAGFWCLQQSHAAGWLPLAKTSGGGGCSYTGPGDILSYTDWGGYRAYSAATCGTKALNVCDNAGANCSDVLTSASTGLLNAAGTHGANNCDTSGTCLVHTIYDKPGGNDVVQTTAANMPIFTPNALNTKTCSTFDGARFLVSGSNSANVAQPYFMSAIAQKTGGGSDAGILSINTSGYTGGIIQFPASALVFRVYAGTSLDVNISLNTWYALQGLFNGASSINGINGSEVTGAGGAQATGANPIVVGADYTTAQPFTGILCEFGFLNATVSSGNRTSLNTNMRAAYGGF